MLALMVQQVLQARLLAWLAPQDRQALKVLTARMALPVQLAHKVHKVFRASKAI